MRVAPLASRMARTVSEQTVAGARKFLGDAVDSVDLSGLILRAVAENVNLIEKAHREYSEDVHEIMSNPENWGGRWEDLQKKLVDRGNVSESRAKLIAKDQTLKFHAAVTEARSKAAGFSGYEWSTSKDERVRPDHVALEGSKQSWSEPPVTNKKTGDRNNPGEDYQCRCVAVPDFDTLSEEQVVFGETSAEQANQFVGRLAQNAPSPAPTPPAPVFVPPPIPKKTPVQAEASTLLSYAESPNPATVRRGIREIIQKDFGLTPVSDDAKSDVLEIHPDIWGEKFGGGHSVGDPGDPDGGRIELAQATFDQAKKALRDLAAGRRVAYEDAEQLSTMFHEELHGSTPGLPDAYSGIGVDIEETTTEALARKKMRDLVPYHASEFTFAGYGEGRAYSDYLLSVRRAVTDVVDLDAEAAEAAVERASVAYKNRQRFSVTRPEGAVSAFAEDLAKEIGTDPPTMEKALYERMMPK